MLEHARHMDNLHHLENMRLDSEIARAHPQHHDNVSVEERQRRDEFKFLHWGGECERFVFGTFACVRWAPMQPGYDPVYGTPNRAAWHREQDVEIILNRIRYSDRVW